MHCPGISCPEDDVVNFRNAGAVFEEYCSLFDTGYWRVSLDVEILECPVAKVGMVFPSHNAV